LNDVTPNDVVPARSSELSGDVKYIDREKFTIAGKITATA